MEEDNSYWKSWIQDLAGSYQIPLVFIVISTFLLGMAFLFWQSAMPSDNITFRQQEATNSAEILIKADMEGAVTKPGVYALSAGSRIQDLLILAGGLSADADRDWVSKNLNLAAKLIDGGKVYIPRISENPIDTANIAGVADNLININSASMVQLEQLAGVGPVTAQKIITNRPYQNIEELLNKKVLGTSTYNKIKDEVTVY